jgi:hypothetical protein
VASLRTELPKGVDEAGGQVFAEAPTFLIGEPGVQPVGLGVGEIDLPVSHVQIPAENYRLAFFQMLKIGSEIPVPLLPVGQALQISLGVRGIHVDQVEVGECESKQAALAVVLPPAHTPSYLEGLVFRKAGRSGVAGLFGRIPVLKGVFGKDRTDLFGPRPDLL